MEKSLKVKVELEVEVDPGWIELVTECNDLFMTDHCGYWLSGMAHVKNKGWLVHEHSDIDDCASVQSKNPEYPAILKAWKEGKPLPDGWFSLDKEMAIKAYCEGIKRDGLNWYEEGDAISYDIAIQLALLGEVRYG